MKKNNTPFFLLAIALFALTSIAAVNMIATPWTLDKNHSSIDFSVRHFFAEVPGTFSDYTADINFSPDNLEESSIDVTIQVASIDTRNERRDGHLRTADFFDAATFPVMTFSSDNIKSTGENTFVAYGTLTIKDVSKDFELPFTLLGIQDNPFAENALVAGIRSEFMLLRSDYGVGTGDWVSDAVVGDEVNVQLNLELNTTK